MNWEKELLELLKLSEEEGIDPDRFRSFISNSLECQKKELLKNMLEEFDEFTIAKSWELDKDKFYIYATPEEFKSFIKKLLT